MSSRERSRIPTGRIERTAKVARLAGGQAARNYEWLCGDAPATPLGEAESEYFGRARAAA